MPIYEPKISTWMPGFVLSDLLTLSNFSWVKMQTLFPPHPWLSHTSLSLSLHLPTFWRNIIKVESGYLALLRDAIPICCGATSSISLPFILLQTFHVGGCFLYGDHCSRSLCVLADDLDSQRCPLIQLPKYASKSKFEGDSVQWIIPIVHHKSACDSSQWMIYIVLEEKSVNDHILEGSWSTHQVILSHSFMLCAGQQPLWGIRQPGWDLMQPEKQPTRQEQKTTEKAINTIFNEVRQRAHVLRARERSYWFNNQLQVVHFFFF